MCDLSPETPGINPSPVMVTSLFDEKFESWTKPLKQTNKHTNKRISELHVATKEGEGGGVRTPH